jgi:hypothetical protein
MRGAGPSRAACGPLGTGGARSRRSGCGGCAGASPSRLAMGCRNSHSSDEFSGTIFAPPATRTCWCYLARPVRSVAQTTAPAAGRRQRGERSDEPAWLLRPGRLSCRLRNFGRGGSFRPPYESRRALTDLPGEQTATRNGVAEFPECYRYRPEGTGSEPWRLSIGGLFCGGQRGGPLPGVRPVPSCPSPRPVFVDCRDTTPTVGWWSRPTGWACGQRGFRGVWLQSVGGQSGTLTTALTHP